MLTVFGPVRSTACILSLGTGIGTPVALNNNVFSVAGGLPSVATNSEVNDVLFGLLIENFAPQEGTKKYWRFNVGNGLPDDVEDPKRNWKRTLKGIRGHGKGIGDLDNVAMIPETEETTNSYIKELEATGMLDAAAKALKEIKQPA
jgi:hypothetical protein